MMLDGNTMGLIVVGLINLATAIFVWRNNKEQQKTAAVVVQSAKNIQLIETATNSMKDALVLATGKAEFHAGVEVGRKESGGAEIAAGIAQQEVAAAAEVAQGVLATAAEIAQGVLDKAGKKAGKQAGLQQGASGASGASGAAVVVKDAMEAASEVAQTALDKAAGKTA